MIDENIVELADRLMAERGVKWTPWDKKQCASAKEKYVDRLGKRRATRVSLLEMTVRGQNAPAGEPGTPSEYNLTGIAHLLERPDHEHSHVEHPDPATDQPGREVEAEGPAVEGQAGRAPKPRLRLVRLGDARPAGAGGTAADATSGQQVSHPAASTPQPANPEPAATARWTCQSPFCQDKSRWWKSIYGQIRCATSPTSPGIPRTGRGRGRLQQRPVSRARDRSSQAASQQLAPRRTPRRPQERSAGG